MHSSEGQISGSNIHACELKDPPMPTVRLFNDLSAGFKVSRKNPDNPHPIDNSYKPVTLPSA